MSRPRTRVSGRGYRITHDAPGNPSFVAPVPEFRHPADTTSSRRSIRPSVLPRSARCSQARPKSALRRLRISARIPSPGPAFSESDLQFRRYTAEDASFAASMFAAGMSHHEKRATHPMTRRMFSRLKEMASKYVEKVAAESEVAGGCFLAFTESGELTGMVAVRVKEKDKEEDKADILLVSVNENFRRRGVGTAVMRYACRFARDSCGAKAVYLNTHQSMESSVNFYRRLGFVETVTDYNVPASEIPIEEGTVVRFDRNLMQWESL